MANIQYYQKQLDNAYCKAPLKGCDLRQAQFALKQVSFLTNGTSWFWTHDVERAGYFQAFA